jgi:hypothetical protein
MREGQRPGWENGLYEGMREKLTGERGRKLYALRKTTIEPVFGRIKIQPARRPVLAKRPSRCALGVTVGGSEPQHPRAHNHWIANTA